MPSEKPATCFQNPDKNLRRSAHGFFKKYARIVNAERKDRELAERGYSSYKEFDPIESIRSYGFSLSNGDRLVALWTDGVAVDDDPGVKANLTFSGFSSKEIIGIDILNNYTQPLITEGDSIKDLIVRDYPLILHIKK